MEVRRTKHPNSRPLSAASLDTYTGRPPELVPVDIADKKVTKVEGRLPRGAGLGGTESVILQHWLLIFGAASGELQLTVADFADWIANRQTLGPPIGP